MPCAALAKPTYRPQVHIITAITLDAEGGIVTTAQDHNYPVNIFVRFYIPRTYGMRQLNRQVAIIAPISTTQFLMDIVTLNFDSFVVPASPVQCAQVVPIGEDARTLQGAVRNVL